jgi:hypothetical protein
MNSSEEIVEFELPTELWTEIYLQLGVVGWRNFRLTCRYFLSVSRGIRDHPRMMAYELIRAAMSLCDPGALISAMLPGPPQDAHIYWSIRESIRTGHLKYFTKLRRTYSGVVPSATIWGWIIKYDQVAKFGFPDYSAYQTGDIEHLAIAHGNFSLALQFRQLKSDNELALGAAAVGDLNFIKFISQNSRDQMMPSELLETAIQNGQVEVAKWVVSMWPDVRCGWVYMKRVPASIELFEISDRHTHRPEGDDFMWAVSTGDVEFLQAVVARGRGPGDLTNGRDLGHAFDVAVMFDRPAMVRHLMGELREEIPEPILKKDAFVMACYFGSVQVARALFNPELAVEGLEQAIREKNCPEIVEWLLKLGHRPRNFSCDKKFAPSYTRVKKHIKYFKIANLLNKYCP